VPDLIIPNLARARSGFGDNSFFGSQNNILNETNGVSNAVSCSKEAVQFSASFVINQSIQSIYSASITTQQVIINSGGRTTRQLTALTVALEKTCHCLAVFDEICGTALQQ